MGYVVTDPNPIRLGWRNYKTNPFAAAQMSGLGAMGLDTSQAVPGSDYTIQDLLDQGYSTAEAVGIFAVACGLDPTQNVPNSNYTIADLLTMGYTPDQIPGMLQAASQASAAAAPASSAGVPDGSILQYNGRWTTPVPVLGLPVSGSDVLQKVSVALANDGLPVRNSSTDAGIVAGLVGGTPFNVQLQIQVATGQGGFNSPNDVISIVRHEVYVATGQMPVSDSIPTMQVPSGGTVSTGQPSGSAPGSPSLTSPSSWLTWLQNNFTTVGLLLVAVTVGPSLIDAVGGKRRR